MIKHKIRIIPLICLLCMLTALCLPVHAFADGEALLTVNTRYNDVPIQNIRWRVLRIGSRSSYGGIDLDPAFAGSGVSFSKDITEEELKTAAGKLMDVISANGTEPDFLTVSDENGIAEADVGSAGIFFVYMNPVDIGGYRYSALPAIVEVRAGQRSEVNPKMESEKSDGGESGPDDSTGGGESGPDDSTGGSESGPDDSTLGGESGPDDSTGGGDESLDDSGTSSPDSLDDSDSTGSGTGGDESSDSRTDSDSSDDTSEPDDTSVTDSTGSGGCSSTPEKLPQTGQLWWPVPVMAFIGMALIALGLRVRSGKGGKDE